MTEKIFEYENLKLTYKTREARKDINHLVVMFSGIRPDKGYEFDGTASNSIQSNWLWIRDEFDGEHTYYLRHKSDDSVQDAVLALVAHELGRLNLTADDCTFVGFSKGGSAALALGIKGNYKNIVAAVPQIAIGDYVSQTRKNIMNNMLLESNDEEIIDLNQLIPNIISADLDTGKNIYLWSAHGDREYATQVQPFLELFDKYDNFNTIITDSPLVTTHNEVTKYNLSSIIAVINLLIIGISPSFGRVQNGVSDNSDLSADISDNAMGVRGEVYKADLNGSKFFPSGVMFLQGIPLAGFNRISKELILTSRQVRKSFKLAETRDKWVNQRYFSQNFINYEYAGFTSRKFAGLDFNHLPDGHYTLSLRAFSNDRDDAMPFAVKQVSRTTSCNNASLFILNVGPIGSTLIKRGIVGERAGKREFSIEDSWVQGDRFHVEGRFAVEGLEAASWRSVDYYLVFKSSSNTLSFRLGAASKRSNRRILNDNFLNYKSAYYATNKFEGISLSQVPTDSYDVYITFVRDNAVFSEKIGLIDVLNGRRATGVFRQLGS